MTTPRRGAAGMLFIVALVATVAATAGGIYYWRQGRQDLKDIPDTALVFRGKFDHIVLEQGEVESSSNVEIICEVKSRNAGTAILSVVDEGTQVKPGDLLLQLDSSVLEQELQQQKIAVGTSEARVITAKSTLDQAEVARDEYLNGTFKQEEKQIESEILIAEEAQSRAKETAKYSEELAALGFQTPQQLRADQFAVRQREVELKLALQKLKTLQEITQKKMLIGFNADIEAAKAQLRAEESTFAEEQTKLRDVERQIQLCEIRAPEAGQVVHANKVSSRGGSEFVVEPGAMVRERQVIIRLPDPEQMRVSAKINESRVPFVEEGMPVAISIGAIENKMSGRVTKVNKYAEPTSFFSSQVKEYATYISIDQPPPSLRTGMTAEVRIFVQQLENVLQIPIQSAYEYKGHIFCLLYQGGEFETREIKIGASNDKFLVVLKGLQEGEHVVRNPREFADYLEIPEIEDPPPLEFSPRPEGVKAPAAAGADSAYPAEAPQGPPQGPRRGAAEGAAGGGRGEEGGAGGGGRGGEGGFNPAAIVDSMFQRFDADKDGQVSAAELQAIEDAQQRDRLSQADTDGDGAVSRAELLARFAAFRGGGGRPGGAAGPGARGRP